MANDEKDHGMCDKCCHAGRENIEICWYFTRSSTGMYAITQINEMIVQVEAAKQGVTVGEGKVSGLMFADISWEYQKHPKDCRNK